MAKRNTASKATATKKTEAPKPMDPTAGPALDEHTPMSVRWCYLLETLRDEVDQAFDDVVYEEGKPDGWGVIHDVTIHSEQGGENALLMTTLRLLDGHPSLMGVSVDEVGGTVKVRVIPDPRTRDSRDPLGIDAALQIMIEGGSE